MSHALSTPTPADTGLPAPAQPPPSITPLTSSLSTRDTILPSSEEHKYAFPDANQKPILLHLGGSIRWNHSLYAELSQKFDIKRSYSMGRDEFKEALINKRWGDFVGMYRPFWNTGGEMGNWDLELISLLPKSCKIYASAGAGFDWVDTKTMAEHGITYCNSAPSCTESVADTALFLLLSTFRAFPLSFLSARSCVPSKFEFANCNIASFTHNPNGHVLGIVGLGRIGFRIAQKVMRACEMRVWYHDVVRMEGREKELEMEGARLGLDDWEVRWCETLEELLNGSDAVVLATPFSGHTLLSSHEFSLFKPGCRLINIARGKLIDEDALNAALDSGTISAAGLDVHAHEPHVDRRLAERESVMVLSHTAGASVESHVGFERLGMENLISWVEGRGCLTGVNEMWLRKD